MADYVIVGATGHVGNILATNLLKQKKSVRVIGRDAKKLESLTKAGAEAAIGSVEDAAFVHKAFEGARAAFLMNPPNFALRSGFRAYQDKITDHFVKALSTHGTKHVVTLSSVGGNLASGNGPIAGLHHMEERVNQLSGAHALHLRPAYFMENMLMSIGMLKNMNMFGGAIASDMPMSMIATKDIGAVASEELSALAFTGKSVRELLGPRDVSMVELTKLIGESIGKPELKYTQFPYDAAKQGMMQMGMSEDMADLYIEMTRGFNDGAVKATQARGPKTNTPTSVQEFVRDVFVPAFRTS
jgi:uncharacterized protein YbjT (DUF2867 family)